MISLFDHSTISLQKGETTTATLLLAKSELYNDQFHGF